ncbi:hypothetical protein [Rhizobium sp. BK491]|uniref:hypothetical protein n=1 Tax=Rhizobium sp. BK491 TaxID=2587009 RepID=UPI00160A625A|nr:hypothetical protein [Rhizobium sp. BK491]MBB3566076.1 hypothetical protein [Rhizobium sp. BK491]
MTYQRPTYEEVRIAHGGNIVTLRPSLRAATILVDRYGFPELARALDEFNLTIICEIIRVSATRADAAAFLSDLAGKPLLPFLLAVRQPLAELVSMFMPAPDSKAKPSAGKGKPMTWPQVYAALYDHATGWLGWTPETAWNATPTEIDRAHAAHIGRLVTTGILLRNEEQSDHDPREEVSEEEVRSGIARLRANAKRGKQ